MKVLHVNDEPLSELGGVSRYLERLLPAQERLGVTTQLLAGFAHHKGLGRIRDFWDSKARVHVEKAAQELGADVIHLHSVLRESSVSVTAARGDIPVVLSVHDPKILGETDHSSKKRGALGSGGLIGFIDRTVKSPWERRVASKHVDLFLPVSEELTRRCRDAGLAPAEWLPGPTQIPTVPLTKASKCHEVLYVGRLAVDKGVAQLLAAWPKIVEQTLEPGEGHTPLKGKNALVLRIVGDGPQRGELQRMAKRLNVDARFDGGLDEHHVSEAYARARIVVLPYLPRLRQASSLAALEAAAHSRPVVVGDDPAVVEILQRLGGGSAVDATNTAALAAKVVEYALDPQRCDAEGGLMASTVMRHYGPDAVAQRSLELYELAIGNRKR